MRLSKISLIGVPFFSLVMGIRAVSITDADTRMLSQLPKDLSFCIADLKFNNTTVNSDGSRGSLKILEFGEGGRSKFKGHDALYGTGTMWAFFWRYMAAYNVPMWLVSMPEDAGLRKEINMDLFAQLGGQEAKNITDLRQHIETSLYQQHGVVTAQHRQDYAAMVLIKKGRPTKTVRKMKEEFPNVIFVGDMSNKFVNNKYRMSLLFMTDELKKYRPQCKTCPVKYDPGMAQALINELGCDIFVIKPVNSSRGRGILMVAKHELDATLRLLFENPAGLLETNLSEEHKYWATYKSPFFLVEQYEPSKPIIIDEQPYDATMRLVFTIDCCAQDVNVTIFDGYWKLPAFPLTADCSLTDKHKSHIIPGLLSSVKIASEDFADAKMLMEDALRKVYWQMVQTRFLLLGEAERWADIDFDALMA